MSGRGFKPGHRDDKIDSARPLVVIDPEDREQVERLVQAYEAAANRIVFAGFVPNLQAALRSLIAPPKPEEPTGLGAVVEDADGKRWVHYPGMFALPWSRPGHPSRTYKELAAVKVLTKGVTE